MKKKSIIFISALLFGQNYLFVHGLKSNSDTFFKMAGDFNSTIIKMGVAHFNQSGTCLMPDDTEVNCSDIASNNTLARSYGLGDNFDTKLYFKEFNRSDTNLSMDDATLYRDQKFHSNSFIVNLSNNIDLTFEAQGKELESAIETIKRATHDDNFVLVGHSMGGLAVRSYLQYDYNNSVNINEAITIATPHGGVNYSIPSSIYGASSENLKSDSEDLLRLNATNLEVYKSIPFISIISSGYEKSIFDGDLISGNEDDGVVSVSSQTPPFQAKILNVRDGIYHTDETSSDTIIDLVKKYSFEHKRLHTGWNLIGGNVEDFNLKSLQIAWHYDSDGWSYYRKEPLDYPKISHINGGFWAYTKKSKDFIFTQNSTFEALHLGWNMIKGPKKVSDLNCTIIWKHDNDKWLVYPKHDRYNSFDTIGKNEGAWCLVE